MPDKTRLCPAFSAILKMTDLRFYTNHETMKPDRMFMLTRLMTPQPLTAEQIIEGRKWAKQYTGGV